MAEYHVFVTGMDRIVDLQFGSDQVACHVIVELYSRGNIILTDENHVILNVLRPRTDKDNDVRFAVREKYPLALARKFDPECSMNQASLMELLVSAKKVCLHNDLVVRS